MARSNENFLPSREVGLPTLTRQLISLLQERREAARARARMRFELGQYSDRALADIGLNRSDIEDVVHGRFGN
ncbi:MAG: DUF1127 domain-containing protein [Gluconacetobacter diazotrophicus]|nr:DUF1127 domain-containing protein [Gluconacetobacter diazotrophicus]